VDGVDDDSRILGELGRNALTDDDVDVPTEIAEHRQALPEEDEAERNGHSYYDAGLRHASTLRD
jgi:hypothetical protein